MSDVTVDVSDLDRLNKMLEAAASRTAKERKTGLDKAARQAFNEAHANASSFTKASTGELAASMEMSGTDLSRTISAPVRQGFFLEFGSPNTGAPRPWLTGPAEKAAKDLLDDLSEAAKPW